MVGCETPDPRTSRHSMAQSRRPVHPSTPSPPGREQKVLSLRDLAELKKVVEGRSHAPSARVAMATPAPRNSYSRQMQQTISFGALGGGILLAGFGLVPAFVGMLIGAGLGYWYERHAAARQIRPRT